MNTLLTSIFILLLQIHMDDTSLTNQINSLFINKKREVLLSESSHILLKKKFQQLNKVKILVFHCEKELILNENPINCFKVLHLAIENGLNNALTSSFKAKVNARCFGAVLNENNIYQLNNYANERKISIKCRNSIEKRREDLLYILAE